MDRLIESMMDSDAGLVKANLEYLADRLIQEKGVLLLPHVSVSTGRPRLVARDQPHVDET